MSVIVSQITLIGCRPVRISLRSAVASSSRNQGIEHLVKQCASMIASVAPSTYPSTAPSALLCRFLVREIFNLRA
jgi:hypothetical protein